MREEMSVYQDMKASIAVLRYLLFCALCIILLTVALGSGLNSHGLKYSHSKGTQCNQAVLTLNVPDSHHCCDSSIHHNDWICKAAFDPVNRISSSIYAYFIALTPMMLNIFIHLFWGKFDSIRIRVFARLKLYIYLFTNNGVLSILLTLFL